MSFPAGGVGCGEAPGRGRGACPGRGLQVRLRPRRTALSSTAPWPEKGGSRRAEEVSRLQAVTAGNHDCSGTKMPRTGTQRVSDRAGPEDRLRGWEWFEGESVPLGQPTKQDALLASGTFKLPFDVILSLPCPCTGWALLLTTALEEGHYYHPHFTEEEREIYLLVCNSIEG